MQFYIATVIDNNDPDKEGKVKIKIDPFHDGFKQSDLPMAKPVLYGTGGGTSQGVSSIPEINSIVWIFFEDEVNFRHPFYFGDLSLKNLNPHKHFNDNVKASITGYGGEYPNVKYQYIKNGICFGVSSDETHKEIFIYHPGGSKGYLYINNDGSYDIKDGNNNSFKLNTDGIKLKDKNSNEVTLSSTGITITDKNGNDIILNSSGSTVQDSRGYKIEFTSTGAKITVGGISLELTPSGFTMSGGGNTISASGSGISINNNFTVGQ